MFEKQDFCPDYQSTAMKMNSLPRGLNICPTKLFYKSCRSQYLSYLFPGLPHWARIFYSKYLNVNSWPQFSVFRIKMDSGDLILKWLSQIINQVKGPRSWMGRTPIGNPASFISTEYRSFLLKSLDIFSIVLRLYKTYG